MPTVTTGHVVRWWASGVKDLGEAKVGNVLKSSHRNCDILLIGGIRMDAVRHCDDPKLDMNKHQRESGAWDFTEEYYESCRKYDDIISRLDALEETLKPGNIKEYQDLRKEAIDLGCEVKGNPKKADLIEMIEEKKCEMQEA